MTSMKRHIYTQETIDAIAQRFDASPPAPPMGTELRAPAVVRALVPKLRQMTEKGYSWQAIARMMADCGVTLSPTVLRKYATAKPDNGKTKKRTRGRRGSGAAQASAVPTAATVPTATPAESVTAPEDAWENLDAVEETDGTSSNALGGAFPSTPSGLESEGVKVGASTRPSSLRVPSSTEGR